jgi:hypothetical protein
MKSEFKFVLGCNMSFWAIKSRADAAYRINFNHCAYDRAFIHMAFDGL